MCCTSEVAQDAHPPFPHPFMCLLPPPPRPCQKPVGTPPRMQTRENFSLTRLPPYLPACCPSPPHPPPQALSDARWHPATPEQQASTGVSIGAGMSCTSEIAEAGALIAASKLRRVSPYFVPRILVNMAAGAVSMRHQLRYVERGVQFGFFQGDSKGGGLPPAGHT